MKIGDSVSNIRRDYVKFKLDESTLKQDPLEQFDEWMQDAIKANYPDPTAMILSTVSADGKPSSRVLLLKGFDKNGFRFYTNYESRKGREIELNPNGAMLFYWDEFERQIRIEGVLKKLTPEESDEYFQSRPYSSRIGAWASEQSAVINSRFTLMRKVAKTMIKYPRNVPLPPFWGGYRLEPLKIEFWQGRNSRLHDRILYTNKGESWEISRLSP